MYSLPSRPPYGAESRGKREREAKRERERDKEREGMRERELSDPPTTYTHALNPVSPPLITVTQTHTHTLTQP